jgi:GT2 family glycosyltransferase
MSPGTTPSNAPALACVIVVTFNSRACFPRLKAALEAQRAPFELVVFDNHSVEAERPNAEDMPASARIVLSETNLGFAAANNRAAKLSGCPFLVLLNPDACPEPNWLGELIAVATRDPRLAAVGSLQISAHDPSRYDGLGDCYHASGVPWRGGFGKPRELHTPEGEPFSACAAAALYRREAWEEAGGFDERFFCYCEDVDLGFRLRLLGWRVAQAPNAIVAHVGGASSGPRSPFAIAHGTRNRTWTFVKNMPGALFWILAPLHATATACFLLISPFRGSGPPTWRGVSQALAGLPQVWGDRRRVQKARKASLLSIARAMTWSPIALLSRSPALRRRRAVRC